MTQLESQLESITVPQRRLNLYRGLVLDAPTWADAHEYHRAQQRAHSLSMHCPGIATGLEVVSRDPAGASVTVHPGVALDEEGHTIMVNRVERLQLQTGEAGTIYLVLQYREIPEGMVTVPGFDENRPRYTLEAYRLEERRELPRDTFVELARIAVSGTGAAVTDAADPRLPSVDEIDLRHRPRSGPCPLGRILIGLVDLATPAGETPRHLAGVLNLVELINATTGYRAEFRGVFDLSRETPEGNLLVLAGTEGFTLEPSAEQRLSEHLGRGGQVLAERCGPAREEGDDPGGFRESFARLAENAGRDLVPVGRGHPLLTALHPFAAPPQGVGGAAQLLAGGGLIYSGGDYGCLWDGGRPESPATREAIRSALELGVNLGVYAARQWESAARTLRASREPG